MCIRLLPLSGQDAIGAEFASNPSGIMGRHGAFTACERFAMGNLRRLWREIRSADIAPFREGDDQQWRDLSARAKATARWPTEYASPYAPRSSKPGTS